MTTVLLTGAAGQVGHAAAQASWGPDVTLVACDRHGLDITVADEIRARVGEVRPDVIVNAAAYTAVDAAEDEPALAALVNDVAVGHLADAANAAGARLIHLSTDYVFNGTKSGWYVETDPIDPMGVYGRTKAAGEAQARRADRHLVLRTSWVYGAHGHNFVRTMRRLGTERDRLGVVDDQQGCPTAAGDIAAAIVDLVIGHPDLDGLFHLASPTDTTWYGFARHILDDRIAQGLRLDPIATTDYPTPAARPANSRLDSSRLAGIRGEPLPDWHDSLTTVLAELDDDRSEEHA